MSHAFLLPVDTRAKDSSRVRSTFTKSERQGTGRHAPGMDVLQEPWLLGESRVGQSVEDGPRDKLVARRIRPRPQLPRLAGCSQNVLPPSFLYHVIFFSPLYNSDSAFPC